MKTWRVRDRKLLYSTPRITLYRETVELPDGRIVDDYEQFDMKDFAIIFAQTADGRVICERQYKHGLRKETLTLPGGQIEDGEDPLVAAQRELLEETGYSSGDWRSLGRFKTHANQGGATVYYFGARQCRLTAAPASGDLEDIQVELFPVPAMAAAVKAGEFGVVADLAAIMLATMTDS
ncbi:NUDIX hydrolase [Ferrovibrio terrae]|uniref:NUDIX hydrolase n=1 Tax=Ferrovibrio terrae TaxID=2594003 RepID=UPI003138180A